MHPSVPPYIHVCVWCACVGPAVIDQLLRELGGIDTPRRRDIEADHWELVCRFMADTLPVNAVVQPPPGLEARLKAAGPAPRRMLCNPFPCVNVCLRVCVTFG